MPKKSFVLMMLLAASLIGISSIMTSQPQMSIAQPQLQQQPQQQPQQPQQSPQQGQLQSPNTAPPTLGKRLTGPQGQQQQQSNVGTLVQIQQDKELVDRLFPYIVQKLDGKTLAQKLDQVTLLRKLDNGFIKRVLAEWVHPYMDLKITITYRDGEKNIQKSSFMELKAGCLPDEIAVSGGFRGYRDNLIKYMPNKVTSPDYWQFQFYGGGHNQLTTTGVNCLKAELGLLSQPRPLPPPPPLQPPGGPPLQPPPNLGK
jgi:hypothetical protein